MKTFELEVLVTYRDFITVEAENVKEACNLVTDPDFNFDMAVSIVHDTDPIFDVVGS